MTEVDTTAPLAPMPDDWERCLAIVAHPDDMEYGASAAVAAWTNAGKSVAYVLATYGEAGIDGEAVIDAVRDAGNRWVFTELVDRGLEPWGGVRWVALSGSPSPTHAVDITDTLERGIASLGAHRVYLEGLGDGVMSEPASFLRRFAEQTASRFNGRLATSFELLEM